MGSTRPRPRPPPSPRQRIRHRGARAACTSLTRRAASRPLPPGVKAEAGAGVRLSHQRTTVPQRSWASSKTRHRSPQRTPQRPRARRCRSRPRPRPKRPRQSRPRRKRPRHRHHRLRLLRLRHRLQQRQAPSPLSLPLINWMITTRCSCLRTTG